MSEKDGQAIGTQPHTSPGTGKLGLDGFSMSAVGAAETQDASEITSRMWRTVGWIVFIAIMIGLSVWWIRSGRDVFWRPEQADQQALTTLNNLPSTAGFATAFGYKNRITLKFELTPSAKITDRKVQLKLRKALTDIVLTFSNFRPNEQVKAVALQGEEELGEAELRNPGAAKPDVWIHIEEEEKSMGGGGSRTLE